MIGRVFGAVALVAVAIGLAGCGEQPQVVRYKQGTYQGKPDTKPWDNPPFSGNKAEWERAIKLRNEAQNEYRRAS
jgi:uncharacterized lipoprotein